MGSNNIEKKKGNIETLLKVRDSDNDDFIYMLKEWIKWLYVEGVRAVIGVSDSSLNLSWPQVGAAGFIHIN